MDSSTLYDLYSYYVAFGSTTSASSSGAVVSSNTESTSTGTKSIVISFGTSSSLVTANPINRPSNSVASMILPPSYTTSAAFGLTTTTSGPSPSFAATTTNSSSHSTLTGAHGPCATTVVLPVDVYFDIPLSKWVKRQDSLYYWVSSPDDSSVEATLEAGAWIHLDPVNARYFHGFTLPILAGTTWLIHMTAEHPDSSASLFDIKIIIDERTNGTATTPSQILSSPSAFVATSAFATSPLQILSSPSASQPANATGRCRNHGKSSSALATTNGLGFVGFPSTTSALATGGARNGFNLGVSTLNASAAVPTATAAVDTPIDEVRNLGPNDLLDIPLGQYLQNSSVDEVDSWSVTPSIAGYNSDWILYDADNATLFGMVPGKSPDVTLLVTVAVASWSQNTTYFLSVKLIIIGQHAVPSTPLPLTASLNPSSAAVASSVSSRPYSALFPLYSLVSSSTLQTLPSASALTPPPFSGWNSTATSIRPSIVPTPFYAGNGTKSIWPSSQISWNGTASNASRPALPVPYVFGSGAGLPHTNTPNVTATATTNSMPSFTITLWSTATAYYQPCPTCPSQATVVSVSTGVTTIPVEVFASYTPVSTQNVTVTVPQLTTESKASQTTTTTTSSDTIEVVATLTRMTTITTKASTSSSSSSRSITVITSTVSDNFVSGNTNAPGQNAASLAGVPIWAVALMPLIAVLSANLFF